jgi:ketosteroid isomerase-like protein
MKKLICSAFVLLLISAGAFAQTAPDAAELTKLLNAFLAGASRNDPAVHEWFWADDLIYTRSAGQRTNKAEILNELHHAVPPKASDPKTVYTAEDIRIQQYGDTAVVAFRLVLTTDAAGTKQVANNLNSGTFVKRNGKWQVVNWQSTRMPRAEADSKNEVAATEAVFQQAILAADVDKLTALTDPSFVWTQGTKELTRQQLIDDLRAGKVKYGKPERTTVSVYGDTAVIRGQSLPSTHYTVTFINQAGIWKAVSIHSN